MQRCESYGQMPTGVKRAQAAQDAAGPRQRVGQRHCVNVRVGAMRVRVSGDFATIMGWVRLALAEREAHA